MGFCRSSRWLMLQVKTREMLGLFWLLLHWRAWSFSMLGSIGTYLGAWIRCRLLAGVDAAAFRREARRYSVLQCSS